MHQHANYFLPSSLHRSAREDFPHICVLQEAKRVAEDAKIKLAEAQKSSASLDSRRSVIEGELEKLKEALKGAEKANAELDAREKNARAEVCVNLACPEPVLSVEFTIISIFPPTVCPTPD